MKELTFRKELKDLILKHNKAGNTRDEVPAMLLVTFISAYDDAVEEHLKHVEATQDTTSHAESVISEPEEVLTEEKIDTTNDEIHEEIFEGQNHTNDGAVEPVPEEIISKEELIIDHAQEHILSDQGIDKTDPEPKYVMDSITAQAEALHEEQEKEGFTDDGIPEQEILEEIDKQDSVLLKQYLELKKKYPDVIMLMRIDSFYQTFNDDAIKVSSLIDSQIVQREQYSVTGFDSNTIDVVLPILVKAGNRVGLCDLLSESQKGVTVKRDIIIRDPETNQINPEKIEKEYDEAEKLAHNDSDIDPSRFDKSGQITYEKAIAFKETNKLMAKYYLRALIKRYPDDIELNNELEELS